MGKLIEPFRFRVGIGPMQEGFRPVALPPDRSEHLYELRPDAVCLPGDISGEVTVTRGTVVGGLDFYAWLQGMDRGATVPGIYRQPDGTELRGHVRRIRTYGAHTDITGRLDPDAEAYAAAEAAFSGEGA